METNTEEDIAFEVRRREGTDTTVTATKKSASIMGISITSNLETDTKSQDNKTSLIGEDSQNINCCSIL